MLRGKLKKIEWVYGIGAITKGSFMEGELMHYHEPLIKVHQVEWASLRSAPLYL